MDAVLSIGRYFAVRTPVNGQLNAFIRVLLLTKDDYAG